MSNIIRVCFNIFPKKIENEEKSVYDLYVSALVSDCKLKNTLKRVS